MHKRLPYLNAYRHILHLRPPNYFKNIFEVGVFKGGSAIFLHQFFEPTLLACVDVTKKPILALDRYIQEQNVKNIRVHLGQNQADQDGLQRVIETDFQSPIDLVIDDASHLYAETKATFEAVFPRLRNGGVYVIEDWGWAHAKRPEGQPAYAPAEKSMVPLLTELLILQASRPNTIEDIHIPFYGLLYLVRGQAPLETPFKLPDAPQRVSVVEAAPPAPRRRSWPWSK
jgi:hypothetical protein